MNSSSCISTSPFIPNTGFNLDITWTINSLFSIPLKNKNPFINDLYISMTNEFFNEFGIEFRTTFFSVSSS